MLERICENPRIELWLGDCLEIMKIIPNKSIDLVFTDPPYGVLDSYSWDKKEYFVSFIKTWIKEMLKKVIEGGGLIMFSAEKYLPLILENEQTFQRILIWDKKCGVGSANNGIWYSNEIISVFKKGDLENKGIKDYQMSVFSLKKERNNFQYGHPTQKPIQLINWIIIHYSNKGDIVLDPFMGSGTTGVACKELNRNFIGIEIEPKYYEIAKRRIINAQTEMF